MQHKDLTDGNIYLPVIPQEIYKDLDFVPVVFLIYFKGTFIKILIEQTESEANAYIARVQEDYVGEMTLLSKTKNVIALELLMSEDQKNKLLGVSAVLKELMSVPEIRKMVKWNYTVEEVIKV